MKNFCKKGLVVLFVLMLALTPMLGAVGESLLTQYTRQALEQGLQLDSTLAIELGEGAGAYLSILGEGVFEAVQKALGSLQVTSHVAKDPKEGIVTGMEMALQETEFLSGQVRMTPTQLEMVTSLLPGKTLTLPLEALGGLNPATSLKLDGELLNSLGKSMETYLGILMNWVISNPDMFSESAEAIPQSQVRDAAVSKQTLRVTGAQLKDLLVQFAAAFEQDTQLQGALQKMVEGTDASFSVAEKAKALSQKVNALEPAQGALVVEMLSDAQGAPVECNLTVDPLFQGQSAHVSAQYTRYTLDGVTHRLEGRITREEGVQMALKLSYDEYVKQDTNAQVKALDLRLMRQAAKDAAVEEYALTNENSTITQEGKETQENVFTLSMGGESASGGEGAAVAAQPLSVEVRSQNVTQGTGGADFTWEDAVQISALGTEFLKLRMNGKSAPYSFQDTSANQVVDLGKATQQEKDALLGELETAASQTLEKVLTLLPEDLLKLLNGQ